MWIALSDGTGARFCPQGLGQPAHAPALLPTDAAALMTRGSIVIETRLPPLDRPRALLMYDQGGWIPLHISLQALPGGGLVFVLDQDGEMLHGAINATDTGRTDLLRVTYSWDAPARWGRLALERPDDHVIQVIDVPNPKPLPVSDIRAIAGGAGPVRISDDVLFVAVSTEIEPIGPMPTLAADTPVATPFGPKPAGEIQRGDLVRTGMGQDVPVLQRIDRIVPAVGAFQSVELRAPYFDLTRDIRMAASQRVVIRGSVVEYMFGTEAVLVPAAHLIGGHAARIAPPSGPAPLVRYVQLLLPRNEALLAAGTLVESLYVGRIRRKPEHLAASLLAGYDRSRLPEHARPVHRVLPPFEAAVLTETRAA